MNRRKPRSYTYRVPLDDKRARRKIRVLDRLNSDYFITEVHRNNVPNSGAAHHWGYKFYESTETRDFETDELKGGTIPGLHKYRYSLDWEPHPETSRLEMRNANGGGTRIKGYQHVGFHDPRLPDDVPVNFTVPWTPTELKAMFDGEPVPNKVDYSHDHPEIEASEARQKYRELLKMAKDDGAEQNKQALKERIDDCDHKVIETPDSYSTVGYCEDCGKGWHDEDEFDKERQDDNLTVVGTDETAMAAAY